MLDERTIEKLSAYSDGELDAQAAGEVERALAQDATLRACLDQFRKLDGTAASLSVPQMSPSTTAAIWRTVRARATGGEAQEGLSDSAMRRVADGLPMPPVVSEDRWQQAWVRVRAQTTEAAARPLDADLTPGPLQAVALAAPAQAGRPAAAIPLWRSFAALAAAAVVLIVATMALLRQPPGTVGPKPPIDRVAVVQPPEALDQRYFVMVKHVPGIEQPVVCFFLKEPDPELEDFELWQ